MTGMALNAAPADATREIVVEDVFDYPPEAIWRVLTTGALIGRWLGMAPTGFAPITGTRFSFRTDPAGVWDGVIHCRILEIVAPERLVFSWQGGDDGNSGYGSRLDTTVSFTLARVGAGTRLRLVHAGFVSPRNDSALRNLGGGWKHVAGRIAAVCSEEAAATAAEDNTCAAHGAASDTSKEDS